jgi:hypothetical protein
MVNVELFSLYIAKYYLLCSLFVEVWVPSGSSKGIVVLTDSGVVK